MKTLLELIMLGDQTSDITQAEKLAFVGAVRREFHASSAMQGLLAMQQVFPNELYSMYYIAQQATIAADMLIVELDKRQ